MNISFYLALTILQVPVGMLLARAITHSGLDGILSRSDGLDLAGHHRDLGAGWFVFTLAAAAALEELMFRGIPGAVSGSWLVGIASALAFAVFHARPGKRLRSLPISQFLGGLWFWYGLTRLGLGAAIAGHVAFNSAIGIFVACLIAKKAQGGRITP